MTDPERTRVCLSIAGSDSGGTQTTAVRDGDSWVLNGTNQTGEASDLAGYLGYYGLTASAPNVKAESTGLAATKIVVYNGAETRLTETTAFLEKSFKVKIETKVDPAIKVDVVITTATSTPTLTPPPSS